MQLRFLTTATAFLAVAAAANAQTYQRRANITGGGDPDRGRCFVEVVVDGGAEIQIRGDNATVTDQHGQQPELRRFECTSPLPPNPSEFRFNGTGGRGTQALVRDPHENGGAAVIRIDDPESGADRYVFDISWRNGFGPVSRGDDRSREGNSGAYRESGYDHRFTRDQAVEACQGAVRSQAQQRFRTGDVNFRQTNIDDQPGRSDWVVGTMEARRPGMPDQILKFSCSVNFANGQIRSAQIDPMYSEGGGPVLNPTAVQNCQRAVGDRLRHDGYDRVEFNDIRADDRQGRADWVVGDLRAAGPYGPESFRFSCNVDMRDGDVRSVDVSTRQR